MSELTEETALRLIESIDVFCEMMSSGRSIAEPESDRMLSRTEAADYCNVSVYTINNYRRSGMITKVVRGCRTGYMQSELDKVKKEKRSQPHKKAS